MWVLKIIVEVVTYLTKYVTQKDHAIQQNPLGIISGKLQSTEKNNGKLKTSNSLNCIHHMPNFKGLGKCGLERNTYVIFVNLKVIKLGF